MHINISFTQIETICVAHQCQPGISWIQCFAFVAGTSGNNIMHISCRQNVYQNAPEVTLVPSAAIVGAAGYPHFKCVFNVMFRNLSLYSDTSAEIEILLGEISSD